MAGSSMRAALTLGVALLLLTAPFALADDHEEDERDRDRSDDDGRAGDRGENATERDDNATDEDERGEDGLERADDAAKREVKVHVEETRAVFELERENAADGEEEVKLDYDADEGVMKLEFSRESAAAETAFEYKLELERVVEYVDVDGNGVFDKDADDVVSEFDVDEDMTWTVLDVEDISTDNATGKRITAEGTFDGANGTMGLVFYAFGDFTDLNGTSLKPTEVKFDFVFSDYPFTNASSALALELKAEYEEEYEAESEDVTLVASAGNVTGYFTWADWAFVDGAESPVRVSGLDEETASSGSETNVEQRLYLNYARGALIVHDPVLGVAYSTGSTSSPNEGSTDGTGDTDTSADEDTSTAPSEGGRNDTPAAGALAALATVGIIALAGRRRG